MPPSGPHSRYAPRIAWWPTGETGCPQRRPRSTSHDGASVAGLVARRRALVEREPSVYPCRRWASAVWRGAGPALGPRPVRRCLVGPNCLCRLSLSLSGRGGHRGTAVAGAVSVEARRHRGHRVRDPGCRSGGPAGWVADVKSVTVLFPILALPAVVGEATYLVLLAVDVPVGSAELFRAAGAIVVAWATFFTGLTWRTYTMTRANNQTLHGVKGAPGGMVADLAALRDDVRGIPADIEHRFDGAVARMQETSAKLEGADGRGGSPPKGGEGPKGREHR